MTGTGTRDAQVQRPNHYTTKPPRQSLECPLSSAAPAVLVDKNKYAVNDGLLLAHLS